MIKKINKLLISFSVLISLLLILAGCDTSVKPAPSITIVPENITANIGENASIAVIFSDFETNPQTVDVYSEDASDPLFREVAVNNNTITVSTADFTTEGSYKIYVKNGDIKSNSCTMTLVAKPETITISSKASAVIKNDLIISVLFDGFKTEPETVDVYSEGKNEPLVKDVKVEDKSIVLSTKDYSIGAYNLYVKAGNAKSNNCALTIVAEKKDSPIINISPSLSVIYGDDASCFVVFSNYRTAPANVDVYIEGQKEPILKNVTVSNNTITLPTIDLTTGTIKIYVVNKEVKSNVCSLEVKKQIISLKASSKYTKGYKTDLRVYVDTENIEEKYKCYENPEYNIYVDNAFYKSSSLSSSDNKYFTLSLPALTLGNHSVYAVLKDNEFVKSNTVEIEIINTLVKTDTLEIVKSSDTKNTIKLNWLNNGANAYFIYYNTTDNFSTATVAMNNTDSDYYNFTFPPTLEDGKYYFWVKVGTVNSIDGKEISDSVDYDFTRDAHTTPTGLKVEKTTTKNMIKLCWNENKACYNHVYINTENDSSTAERYKSTQDNYIEIILPNAGDFYFWVRASDDPSSTPKESCTSDYSKGLKYTFETFDPIIAKPTIANVKTDPSVSITCNGIEGASCYFIYTSLTNDISTAKYIRKTPTFPLSLNEDDYISGKTNYFWARAANSSTIYSAQFSDFSDVYEIAIP